MRRLKTTMRTGITKTVSTKCQGGRTQNKTMKKRNQRNRTPKRQKSVESIQSVPQPLDAACRAIARIER